MSLLKETLENNHIDTPDGINILDNLQYENALNNFQSCYKEFLSVNEDCKNVLEKHDLIKDNLQNESALKNVLMDLELLTSESAIPPKELAAKALREIKFMLKNILTRFIELFTKLKNFIINFFKRNEELADTLKKELENLGDEKKVYSLDHEEFNNHLPLVLDFGNTGQIFNMLKELLESGSRLKNNNFEILALEKKVGIKPNGNLLIECSKSKISYLTCNENSKLKIEIEHSNFRQKEIKSRLLSKSNLAYMLDKIISFNKITDKYINDFETDSKKLLDKINKITNNNADTDHNLVHNIRVSLEANGKFSNNIIHVTKGVFFVIASNIKCYENK